MKKVFSKSYLWVFLITALFLARCSAANNPETAGGEVGTEPPTIGELSILRTDYENALPVATQLAIGLFKLDDTHKPLSTDQAAALIPLWKAYRSLTTQENSSNKEIDALIIQIQGTLNPDQLKSIADLQLTGQDMMQLAQENNLALRPGGPGGFGEGLTAEERATRQAQRFEGGGTGPGGGPGMMIQPAGGMPQGGGMMPGGELPPGAMATPSVRQTAIAQRVSSGASWVNSGLVEALIAFLETKTQE